MPASGYTAITFVADELLTSTKMNQMGANDAAFNNGNGFNDGIIVARHFAAGAIGNAAVAAGGIYTSKVYNPYKFSAYRSSAYTGAGATPLVMNAESFDTGNNHSTSTGLFTAPVNGFYFFEMQITQATGAFAYMWATIFKNGVEYRRGNRFSASAGNGVGMWAMAFMQLTAGDTVSFGFASSASVQLEVGDQLKTMAEGWLVSAT